MSFIAWEMKGDDMQAAARMYEEIAETDPSDPWALQGMGQLASNIGRTELAIRINEYVAERDPMSLWSHFNLGWSYLKAGRYEDAVRQYAVTASLAGDSKTVRWRLGLAKLLAGDPQGAMQEFEKETGEHYRLHGLSMALHDLGREDDSAATTERLRELEYELVAPHLGESDDLEAAAWPHGFARIYAWIGNSDEAFRYMRIALEVSPDIFGALAVHPLFTKLHDDPRWLPLLHEVGQAPEQLAAIKFNSRLPADLRRGN